MKRVHLHREAGIRIYDDAADETVYLDTLQQAAADAETALDWVDPHIVRVFPLEDGRIAVVRETPAGLRQEADSPMVQGWLQQLATKADVLMQKQAERQANETSVGAEASSS